MTKTDLSDIYRGYIACLNKQDWPNLGKFIHEEVYYNGERVGFSGYRKMLEGDFRAIPDLYFDIHLLISEPPRVASRLRFDCTPKGILFGVHVNGKRVTFTEGVYCRAHHESSVHFERPGVQAAWALSEHSANEPIQTSDELVYIAGSRKCMRQNVRKGINLAQHAKNPRSTTKKKGPSTPKA